MTDLREALAEHLGKAGIAPFFSSAPAFLVVTFN